jgi:hypothetical protein
MAWGIGQVKFLLMPLGCEQFDVSNKEEMVEKDIFVANSHIATNLGALLTLFFVSISLKTHKDTHGFTTIFVVFEIVALIAYTILRTGKLHFKLEGLKEAPAQETLSESETKMQWEISVILAFLVVFFYISERLPALWHLQVIF